MLDPRAPESLKPESKPSNFCPGCGYGLILKTLGEVIDEMEITTRSIIGLDIGCNLLAWDYYNVDTLQTHHGRVTPLLSGYKHAEKDGIVIGIAGDGGLYSIGLQSFLHAAHRNEAITIIGVNNTLYGMTGGQAAPTTMPGEITDTTPGGAFTNDKPIFGPELVKDVAHSHAYLARATILNLPQLKVMVKKAIETQLKGNFAFVEVISMCPTNWKTNAADTMEFARKMGETFKVGVINE